MKKKFIFLSSVSFFKWEFFFLSLINVYYVNDNKNKTTRNVYFKHKELCFAAQMKQHCCKRFDWGNIVFIAQFILNIRLHANKSKAQCDNAISNATGCVRNLSLSLSLSLDYDLLFDSHLCCGHLYCVFWN